MSTEQKILCSFYLQGHGIRKSLHRAQRVLFSQVTDAAAALRAEALLSVGSNAFTPHRKDGIVHPCVPVLLPTAPCQLTELNENETQIASAQALVSQFRKSQNAEAAVTLLS